MTVEVPGGAGDALAAHQPNLTEVLGGEGIGLRPQALTAALVTNAAPRAAVEATEGHLNAGGEELREENGRQQRTAHVQGEEVGLRHRQRCQHNVANSRHRCAHGANHRDDQEGADLHEEGTQAENAAQHGEYREDAAVEEGDKGPPPWIEAKQVGGEDADPEEALQEAEEEVHQGLGHVRRGRPKEASHLGRRSS